MWLKNLDLPMPLPFYTIMAFFAIIIMFLARQVYYQYITYKTKKNAKNGVIYSKGLHKLVYHRLHYSGDYHKLRFIDGTKVFVLKSKL